jgi:uncharacterized protein (DUF488 family)
VIYTVGHGARSFDELTEVLRSVDVQKVIDVRRFPGSRRHPHFARGALEQSLPSVGIDYEWWGEELGGRREEGAGSTRHPAWRNKSFQSYADHMDTMVFREALDRLEQESATTTPALMCAETLWWRCHRRLISDALVLRGNEVVHLISAVERRPHEPHPALRPDEEGNPVYDLGETGELPL